MCQTVLNGPIAIILVHVMQCKCMIASVQTTYFFYIDWNKFLVVGHTHETSTMIQLSISAPAENWCIDNECRCSTVVLAFYCYSQAYQHNFLILCSNGAAILVKPNSGVCVYDAVHAWYRQWIEPHLEEIHKHTAPHIFLFKKSLQGRAEMFYKHWSKDEWSPSKG